MTTALPQSTRRRNVHIDKDTKPRKDYVTPPAVFDPLHAEFGFTLDAAASAENAKCPVYFTEADDGLAQPWSGVVWLNPPYGQGIGEWVRKASLEAARGVTSVLLIPASTDTRWWHDYIWDGEQHGPREGVEVRFPKGRINFIIDGQPTKGSTVTNVIVVFRAAAAITGPVLTARTGTNAPLFADICRLYLTPGARVLDATFGRGNFWKVDGLPERYRLVRMDMEVPGCDLYADFTRPPFADRSFDAVILDPPYANNGGPHAQGIGIDSSYNLKPGLSHQAIQQLYRDGINAAHRLLVPGGVLVVKAQDQVEGSRQQRTTIVVWQHALSLGMVDEGDFVLVRPGTPPLRHAYQQHARRNHSLFWVFRASAAKQLSLVV